MKFNFRNGDRLRVPGDTANSRARLLRVEVLTLLRSERFDMVFTGYNNPLSVKE